LSAALNLEIAGEGPQKKVVPAFLLRICLQVKRSIYCTTVSELAAVNPPSLQVRYSATTGHHRGHRWAVGRDRSPSAPPSNTRRDLAVTKITALAEAAGDPIVERALNRVASARIEYLEACYRELGLAQPRAKAKAVFAYAAYRGLLQVAHEAPAVLPNDWSSYATVVLESLDPAPRTKRRPGRQR